MDNSSHDAEERERSGLHPMVRQALEERERLLAERKALLKERARLLKRLKRGTKRRSGSAS
jgi:hypothetical protein